MTEHPILFSGEMVRAILAGRKTQTRRIVKPQPGCEWYPTVGHYHPTIIDRHGDEQPGAEIYGAADEREGRKFPYGKPGDRLWVRETWRKTEAYESIYYRADEPYAESGEWKPSIHMPKWASRITLQITAVRVERVRAISAADAIAEGLYCFRSNLGARNSSPTNIYNHDGNDEGGYSSPIEAFENLWDSINGKRAPWASNPWVWVVEFKKIDTAPASGV